MKQCYVLYFYTNYVAYNTPAGNNSPIPGVILSHYCEYKHLSDIRHVWQNTIYCLQNNDYMPFWSETDLIQDISVSLFVHMGPYYPQMRI